MKIDQDKVVALSYQLEVEGKIADSATSEAPLEYIQGNGMLIPKFEAEVAGKEPGESFEFTLSPEEGYGAYNPEYKFPIPIATFQVDGKMRDDLLKVGRTIPMMNSAGQVVQGTIAEINEDSVVMDFNHPMAGKTLHFTGKVESVREATEKELNEGLHGEFLPPEEGCHGGCHGGGCHGGNKENCDGQGGCGCKHHAEHHEN